MLPVPSFNQMVHLPLVALICNLEKSGTYSVTPKREYRCNWSMPRIMDHYCDMI